MACCWEDVHEGEKGQRQNDGQWELQEDLAPSVGF